MYQERARRLAAFGKRGDIGIGEKRRVGIVLAIALVISTSPLTWVSAQVVPAFDPGAPPETRIRLAPFLTFGARVELEYELEKNFDLKDARDDDVSTLEPRLSLAFSFDPNKHFQAFLNLELSKEFTLEEEGKGKKRPTKLVLSQAFISLKEVMDGLSLQIGRQRFKDDREWLYDERLDAVRAFYRVSNLSLELSVSRKGVVDRDLFNHERKERINNYLLYGRYRLSDK